VQLFLSETVAPGHTIVEPHGNVAAKGSGRLGQSPRHARSLRQGASGNERSREGRFGSDCTT